MIHVILLYDVKSVGSVGGIPGSIIIVLLHTIRGVIGDDEE